MKSVEDIEKATAALFQAVPSLSGLQIEESGAVIAFVVLDGKESIQVFEHDELDLLDPRALAIRHAVVATGASRAWRRPI